MRVSILWHVIAIALAVTLVALFAVSTVSGSDTAPMSQKSALKGPPACC